MSLEFLTPVFYNPIEKTMNVFYCSSFRGREMGAHIPVGKKLIARDEKMIIYEAMKMCLVTMQGYTCQTNQHLQNNMFPLFCFFWTDTLYVECASLKLMEK